jgi:hypothetical protein
MVKLIGKLKNRMRNRTSKTDHLKEIVPIEEVGKPENPEGVLHNKTGEEAKKLVVVGKESVFSQEIIDYALDMAQRMTYEIVALNTAPLSCETVKASSSGDRVCEDFKMLSQLNVKPFREAAEKRNIPFFHVVKFSESYEVLAELRKEIGEFEFVVSEEERDSSSDRVRNEKRPKQEIFVYSML